MFHPVRRFLVPPRGGEAETASVVAGTLNELPPNSGKVFPFGSRPAIVVRTPDGELRAFSAVCTHLDCTVQFKARHVADLVRVPQRHLRPGGQTTSRARRRGRSSSSSVNVRGEAGREEVVVSRS